MSNEKDRLRLAQWILERNLAWISAAEVKVGVIVAINTAMLGSLGAVLGNSDESARSAWAYVWLSGAALTLASGIFCAAMAVIPRLSGPTDSLVFFGCINKLEPSEYDNKFKIATDAHLLEDWTAQIHRNAQIACNKFEWVRTSMIWSFTSVVPWFGAIITML